MRNIRINPARGIEASDFSILVVEDEAELREIFTEELDCAGYTVHQAADGALGLKAIIEHRPDIVLCDITMPNMNGHQLLREVRASDAGISDTVFIFLSALAAPREVKEGLVLGSDDYLTKPIDYDFLLIKLAGRCRELAKHRAKSDAELVKLYKNMSKQPQGPIAGDGEEGGADHRCAMDAAPPSSNEALQVEKRKLSEMAHARNGDVVAGRFHVIYLDAVKDRVGDDWARLADRIYAISEKTIRKSLTKEDVCRRTGGGKFLICFKYLNETEASAKTDAIRKGIFEKLLGERCERESVEVSAEVRRVSVTPEEVAASDDPIAAIGAQFPELPKMMAGKRESVRNAPKRSRKGKPVWAD